MSPLLMASLVGLGGMLGSLSRWAVSQIMNYVIPVVGLRVPFPWATLAVNSFGCLLAGLGAGLLSRLVSEPVHLAGIASNAHSVRQILQAFLLTGFCGGFTTFSAFGVETLNIARDGAMALAAANVIGNLALGLALTWLGFWIGG